MFSALVVLFRLVAGLVILAGTWFVFDKIHDRNTEIIVATIGLLYSFIFVISGRLQYFGLTVFSFFGRTSSYVQKIPYDHMMHDEVGLRTPQRIYISQCYFCGVDRVALLVSPFLLAFGPRLGYGCPSQSTRSSSRSSSRCLLEVHFEFVLSLLCAPSPSESARRAANNLDNAGRGECLGPLVAPRWRLRSRRPRAGAIGSWRASQRSPCISTARRKQSWPGYGIYLGNGLILTAAHVAGEFAQTKPHVVIAGQDLPGYARQGRQPRQRRSDAFVDRRNEAASRSADASHAAVRASALCGERVVVAIPEGTAPSKVLPRQAIPADLRGRFDTAIADVATTGNSGSGVFDARDLCLLGIISRKISDHFASIENWRASSHDEISQSISSRRPD